MQLTSRGPRTYLHGDLHIANTYLKSHANGAMGVRLLSRDRHLEGARHALQPKFQPEEISLRY